MALMMVGWLMGVAVVVVVLLPDGGGCGGVKKACEVYRFYQNFP